MAIPSYTDIKDLVKKGLTIEAQEKIIELREAALALQEENLKLKERVQLLEDEAKLRAAMTWEKPYYWRQIKSGEKDGPYCQGCYDKDRRLARLQDRRRGMWACSVCKTTYYDESYRLQQTQVRTSNWVKGY